jgi:ribosomal protein S27AE
MRIPIKAQLAGALAIPIILVTVVALLGLERLATLNATADNIVQVRIASRNLLDIVRIEANRITRIERDTCAPACIEGSIMAQSQGLSSVIPFAEIERPACPKCRASMRLASIEPARALDVDLHAFKCTVCNQVLQAFAAYEDAMKSKALGTLASR